MGAGPGDFTGVKDDGTGGDNWSCKMCKTLLKSSAPTSNFLQAGCSSCRPANSVRTSKAVFYIFANNRTCIACYQQDLIIFLHLLQSIASLIFICRSFLCDLNIQEAQLMLTTGSTHLAVSQGQQTWYHFRSIATFC